MDINLIIIILYGIFLLVGGVFGARAGSNISLIMGCISGLLILGGAIIFQNNPVLGGKYLATIGGVLAVVFLRRLLVTKKFMPSGMLMAISGIFSFYFLNAL